VRFSSVLFVLSVACVAGCSQQPASSPARDAALAIPRTPAAVSFSTIYSFKGAPDGAGPEAGLNLFAGKFYGTTLVGGTGQDGTLYDVDENGKEHVLHGFTGSPDGAFPEAALTNLNNSGLYGTTASGGDKSSFGTVYELQIDSSVATYRAIYSFKKSPDGNHPFADLAVFGNSLFGTTLLGGTAGKGTVFEVHPDGTERVVYSFAGAPDGDGPTGGLADANGALYGTTEHGGANNFGCVFKVQTDGTERVIYSFKGGSADGKSPIAGLTVANGLLYGVTSQGGTSDDGTIFELHEDGTERVVHSFSGSDGRFPYGPLTVLKGLLYGTTRDGGTNDLGTVFEVHPDGTFRSLHSFIGSDGSEPAGSLTVAAGNAFAGTTRKGGVDNHGTVFLVQL
jgi:uncharacterized repeat protein (TIGR03803 family)